MTSRDSVPPARSGLSLLVGLALCGAGGLRIAADAAVGAPGADAVARPYGRIPTRNVFGVKPPPPPAPVEKPPEPPKERPDFFLTGLIRRGAEIQALIAYQPKGKPIEYPDALVVGVLKDLEIVKGDEREKVGSIQLVSVGDDGESIQIEFNGEVLTLDFEKNAAKAVGPSGAPAAPGAPGGNPNAPKGTLPPAPVPALGIPVAPAVSGLQGGGSGGPTVVGRGGEVLGGFNGLSTSAATFSTPAASASGLPAINAGGSTTGGGIPVPAVQGVLEIDPTATTRRRNREVVLPPFPGLPGN